MTKKTLEIHSENILPIIKKWLYSDKDIFVRELVSNACDAIHKVKILKDEGKIPPNSESYRIDVALDKAAKTLTFSDTGIGMDAEEVEKYIAQIAFSGAEDFVEKYKSNKESDQFIGHFGLGFYSAYMVASKVEIDTLSYKPEAKPVFWSCDGSHDYEIHEGVRKERGTTITLFIDEASHEYLEKTRLKEILNHYCSFLPYPVYFDGELINARDPLWIQNPAKLTDKDYLNFYRYLYPADEDPLFWIHLNVDYPFHLKGILYFPKLKRDMDINKNTIKLYCNRVFVSDNCKDIVPNYLAALKGVLDSPDIPLNVSRSYLQMDRTVRQLSSHISKKVADSLGALYKSDHERFTKVWNDISIVIKLGVLEDDKFFEKVKEFLIWKDTNGKYLTVEEYLSRNGEKTKDAIYYTLDDKHLTHFVEVYKEKGIDVVIAGHSIDPYVMQAIERKMSNVQFKRIDASIDDHLIDKSKEKSILDSSGKTEAAHLADFIRSKLTGVEVEAKSLASDSTPGFIMMDEGTRRLRDYMLSLSPEERPAHLHELHKKTFVVNTNSKLVSAIQDLDKTDPDLAKDLVQEVYELSELSQREMMPETLHTFVQRTNSIIEKLITAANLK